MICYGNLFLSTAVVFLLSRGFISLSLPEISNDPLNVFQKIDMHFIHLNVNILLFKIDEIRCIAKLTDASVIGLSKTKLDNTVLSSELEMKGYDMVRFEKSRRGGGEACFVKNSFSYNRKPNFCINAECLFIEIFLPQSKPVLTGSLYRPRNKFSLVNYLERMFNNNKVIEF